MLIKHEKLSEHSISNLLMNYSQQVQQIFLDLYTQ